VRVVRLEERSGESMDGEDPADIDEPAGELEDGNEDAGDEAERYDDRLHDRLGRVRVGDEGGDGETEAAEDHGAEHDVEEEGRRRSAEDVRPVGVRATAVRPATSARPVMTALAGTGVARRRL
jgi:hypothetical protein